MNGSDGSREEGAFQRLLGLFGASAGRRFEPFDLGVLKVALMVAAIDGTVKPVEVSAFKRLARRCHGWTGSRTAELLSDALHSAGYLVVEAQLVKERALVAAFVREARKVLPRDFAQRPVADVRRAFVMWLMMSWSDRTFAFVERKAILALRRELGLRTLVPDRFLREVVKDILLVADARTIQEGVTLLGAFADLT